MPVSRLGIRPRRRQPLHPLRGPSEHHQATAGLARTASQIVTGGASGIGLATVERFHREGASVVVGDIDKVALDRVKDAFDDAVTTVGCDVTSEADVERPAQTAIDTYGRLDIAFANAGIGISGLITDADLTQWKRVVDVCLVGPLLTIKHAARRMNAGGSIVVTASLNAVQPGRGLSAYCAAKAGVAMLVEWRRSSSGRPASA